MKNLVIFFLFIGSMSSSSCSKKADPVVPESPTAAREAFLGAYLVTKGCTLFGVSAGATIDIAPGSGNNGILINGVASALVSGSSFTLVKFTDTDGSIISGNGTLSGKVLTFNVTSTKGTSSQSCTLTCQKQ